MIFFRLWHAGLGLIASLVCISVVGILGQGCTSEVVSCWGTCEQEGDCGDGLICDTVIGYCVREVGNPKNVEACELEVDKVWVCAEHDAEIPLGNQHSDAAMENQDLDVRGLPSGVTFAGNSIEGSFAEGEHQIAWGDPPNRHIVTIKATTQCPQLDLSNQPRVCTGSTLSATLAATGGSGKVKWSLVGDTKGYTIDDEGNISGVVNHSDEVVVAMVDERDVRVETPLTITSLAGCPSIRTTELPASCAGSTFEWEIDATGLDAKFREPSVVSDDPARDLERLRLSITKVSDSLHRLQARPRADTSGRYVLALVLDDNTAPAQIEIPFEVRDCPEESAVVSCTDEVNVSLGSGKWSLTSPDNNPMRSHATIIGDNQLSFARQDLPNGSYTVNLTNPSGQEESLLLVLSSPGATGCVDQVDAGGAGSGATADAAVALEPDVTSMPSNAAPEGCVDDVYSYNVPLEGVASGTWRLHPRSELPDGLSLDADTGTIRGRPRKRFDQQFTIEGIANGHDVEVTRHLTVHEKCRAAFLGKAPQSPVNRLFSVDRRAPSDVVELSSILTRALDEVVAFVVSPGGHYIAFASHDTEATQPAQLFVVRSGGDVDDPELPLELGELTLPEAITGVKELSWSAEGQLSVVAAEELSDAGLSDWLFVFDLRKEAQSAAPVLSTPVTAARGLMWMGDNPCLVSAADSVAESATSICWNIDDGEAIASLPRYSADILTQARINEGVWLLVSPVDGYADLMAWAPFDEELPSVVHQAEFASPLGDIVATERSAGLEIARATDQTLYDAEDGHNEYQPITVIPNCSQVDAWANSGFACSNEDDDVVTIVSEGANQAFDALVSFSDPVHQRSGQRLFVGSEFYLFADLAGSLRSVQVSEPSPNVVVSDVGGGSGPVALIALDDRRFLAQTSSHLVRGTFEATGALSFVTIAGDVTPSVVETCEGKFSARGFDRWCGGDRAPRRFQVAAAEQFGLLLSDSKHLVLFDPFAEAAIGALEDHLVTCTEDDQPDCLDQFAISR
jgi:hypothetical protein